MAIKRFIQAAPTKTGRSSRKSLPIAPANMKEHWERSVFYYWWAFLRENADYWTTCENGGEGPCSALYADFGDVRGEDFWAWWKTHQHLFAEPPSRQVAVIEDVPNALVRQNVVVLEVPLEGKLSYRITQVRRELERRMTDSRHVMLKSEAKYQVHGKPVVKALAAYLETYKLKKKYPKLPLAYIFDLMAGYEVDIDAASKPVSKQKKYYERRVDTRPITHTQLSYRNNKFAKEIIENVVKGLFPLFNQPKPKKLKIRSRSP